MNLMIKDLKTYAAGTLVKGFPLLIKTARKAFTDANEVTWQEVVFMDSSGEITGHIYLPEDEGKVCWKSKTNICIMNGTIQDTDERKREAVKIVVTECFDAATPLTFDQGQDMQAEDWRRLREDEIKGKIRHGLVCSLIRTGQITKGEAPINDANVKSCVNRWVDFIITGE